MRHWHRRSGGRILAPRSVQLPISNHQGTVIQPNRHITRPPDIHSTTSRIPKSRRQCPLLANATVQGCRRDPPSSTRGSSRCRFGVPGDRAERAFHRGELRAATELPAMSQLLRNTHSGWEASRVLDQILTVAAPGPDPLAWTHSERWRRAHM